jgi:hypothetical protein
MHQTLRLVRRKTTLGQGPGELDFQSDAPELQRNRTPYLAWLFERVPTEQRRCTWHQRFNPDQLPDEGQQGMVPLQTFALRYHFTIRRASNHIGALPHPHSASHAHRTKNADIPRLEHHDSDAKKENGLLWRNIRDLRGGRGFNPNARD